MMILYFKLGPFHLVLLQKKYGHITNHYYIILMPYYVLQGSMSKSSSSVKFSDEEYSELDLSDSDTLVCTVNKISHMPIHEHPACMYRMYVSM